jgi:hypothetical protein
LNRLTSSVIGHLTRCFAERRVGRRVVELHRVGVRGRLELRVCFHAPIYSNGSLQEDRCQIKNIYLSIHTRLAKFESSCALELLRPQPKRRILPVLAQRHCACTNAPRRLVRPMLAMHCLLREPCAEGKKSETRSGYLKELAASSQRVQDASNRLQNPRCYWSDPGLAPHISGRLKAEIP